MRYALIPTKKAPSIDNDYKVGVYLRKAGWHVIYLEGKKSIFEAYTDGIEQVVRPGDHVIMCHDDIEILMDVDQFNEVIDFYLSNDKTGFIGVAGTALLSSQAVWWEGLGSFNPVASNCPLRGIVNHGNSINEMHLSIYGTYGRTVVMDGVFLAAKGSVLKSIKTAKPELFSGDWDFYDLYFTIQAHLKGLHNYCVPINILHYSPGPLKEGWYNNQKAFIEMFGKHLPLFVE